MKIYKLLNGNLFEYYLLFRYKNIMSSVKSSRSSSSDRSDDMVNRFEVIMVDNRFVIIVMSL